MQWNTQFYDQHHSFVTEYGAEVLALLAPQTGERILDVGCGTGHLTRKIAEAGATAVGMDRSSEMVSAAREAHPLAKFEVADAAEFSLETLGEKEPFDALFSNAALHWIMRQEDSVIAMSRVLRSGGRFVVEFGGKGNIEQITRAFEEAVREEAQVEADQGRIFLSISEYSTLLERHGFLVRSAELYDRPTKLDGGEAGLRNWLVQFNSVVLQQLSPELQEAVLASTEEKLRPRLFENGSWIADYRRLKIVAVKD